MADARMGHSRAPGREARILVALFLATLLPRVLLLLVGRLWDTAVARSVVITGDAAGYEQRALSVFGPNGFYPPIVGIDYIRPPVFPIFVASIYRIAGVYPWHVLFAQALLAGFTCLLLYRAVRHAMSPRAAIFMVAGFALDPSLILQSNLFLSEALFLFFLALALALLRTPLETRLESRSHLSLAAAGLCVGLATLTRPAAQFIPLALAPIFFLVAPRPIRRPIVASLLVGLVFLGSITPWVLRNRAAFGVPSISVIQDWSPFFKVLVAPVEAAKTGESLLQVEDRLARETALLARTEGLNADSLNEFQRARYWRRLTLRYVQSDPRAYASLCARRTVLFFANLQTSAYANMLHLRSGSTDIEMGRNESLKRLSGDWLAKKTTGEKLLGLWTMVWLGLTYVCLGVGLWVAWARGRSPLLLGCLVLALGFIAAGAPVGEARFRTSALLFYLPFIGIGADQLWSRRPGARRPAGLPADAGPGPARTGPAT
jgi:4-amino-4-deoxy-L-arabinose transferase-like glycosyltransferase